jgi:UPF0716 family protein affecting phage T7 exclusion
MYLDPISLVVGAGIVLAMWFASSVGKTAAEKEHGIRQLHHNQTEQRNQAGPSDFVADSASIDRRP